MSKILYVIDGIMKDTEKDIWEEGCQPDTHQSNYIEEKFSSEEIPALLQEVADFLGTGVENFNIEDGAERGKIFYSRVEDAKGHEVEEGSQLWNRWKKGDREALWDASYTFYLKRHLIKPVNLKEEINLEAFKKCIDG